MRETEEQGKPMLQLRLENERNWRTGKADVAAEAGTKHIRNTSDTAMERLHGIVTQEAIANV
jgi:hypothetical protein